MNSVPAITTGPMDRYTRPTRRDTAIEAAQILTGVDVGSDTPASSSSAPAPPAPAPPAPKAPATPKAKASGSGLRGR